MILRTRMPFIRTIAAGVSPLVYADWLDEQGDCEVASVLRHPDIMTKPIRELWVRFNYNVRHYNRICSSIETCGGRLQTVITKTPHELREFIGVGWKTVADTQEFLEQLGLSLKPSSRPEDTIECVHPSYLRPALARIIGGSQ